MGDVLVGVLNSNTALFGGVLELVVAAHYIDLEPAIRLQQLNNLP